MFHLAKGAHLSFRDVVHGGFFSAYPLGHNFFGWSLAGFSQPSHKLEVMRLSCLWTIPRVLVVEV